MTCNAQGPERPTTPYRAMETLIDKFKREQGGLRRSRSVRASLRLIGNRWRSKDEEPSDIEKIQNSSILFSKQIWTEKDYDVAYTGIEGTYKSKTPIMAKRKPDLAKQRRKSGDIDLTLKLQRPKKVEKKFTDLFTNKKQKSVSAKELIVPEEIPPKAAALLHIHAPEHEKVKKKLKGMGKSESAKSISELTAHKRVRRGSESDMCPNQPRGCVNPAFVYSTPPKDRKMPMSPTAYLSMYIQYFFINRKFSRITK